MTLRKRLRKKLYKSGYLFTVTELKSAFRRTSLANKAKSQLASAICGQIKTVDSILDLHLKHERIINIKV